MGSIRDDLLDVVNDIRAIPGEFGLHRFAVYVRVSTFGGPRVGKGAETVLSETRLLVGGQNPHVRELNTKDRVAGNSALKQAEYEIGPFTQDIVDQDLIDPPGDGTPKQVHYVLKGPGMPPEGLLCQRTDDATDRPFRTMVRVRSIGRNKPSP